MSGSPQDLAWGSSVDERLVGARRRHFVGRAAELELFRSALQQEVPPFSVLLIHGPGGIGKTALLGEYARLAEEAGRPTLRLDGHEIQPSVHGFALALAGALGLAAGEDPAPALSRLHAPVLLLDTFEILEPLDGWLRQRLLPLLPANSITVIAGRNPPSEQWLSDPGWSELARVVSLRNLRPEESRALLAARGVASDEHEAILRYTYGHPLALSLAARVSRQGRRALDLAAAGSNIIGSLLERFVATVPSPAHRAALETAAVALRVTQPTLQEALKLDDETAVFELFEWLRRLPIIDEGPLGLFPHDLVRDVLREDLRRRDPEKLERLTGRVGRLETRRFFERQGLAQQQALWSLLFLYRHHPSWWPFYDWGALGATYAQPARLEDHSQIVAMVERHEGTDAARIAEHWLRRQPEGFCVFRAVEGEVTGFCCVIRIDRASEEDEATDPAVQALRRYVERAGPLRPGEGVSLHRFWMDAEGMQTPAAHNMAATAAVTFWMNEPALAWSFVALQDPEFYLPLFAAVDFFPARGAAFVVGERWYTVVGHDWRVEPPDAWWRTIGERRPAASSAPARPRPAAPRVVLSQPDFRDAVRRAYRDFTRPEALATNPLIQSRVVLGGRSEGGGPGRLQAILREAAESLNAHPRDQKLYRALWHTYVEPAPSQEAASELLDLPFSTYRRHLKAGLDRATEWLWRRELYGFQAE